MALDAPHISAEARLVYRSASRRGSDAEVAALVAAVTDWGRVVALAEREVATSALWRTLKPPTATAVPDGVPTVVTDHLRRSAMVSDFRMQMLAQRLQSTVATFRAAGIPVLLLKGAAVGAVVDPTFRTRPMTDLDVLISRDDIVRARAALLSCGWAETSDTVLLELLQDHHHLPPFVDAQNPGTRLELHIAALPLDHRFALDDAELWRSSAAAGAPFLGARVPSAELFVLHACIHFGWAHTMAFGAWRTFRAISAYLEGAPIDWDRFVALAERTRAASVCHWTLRLGAHLAGLPVPARVLDRLEPPVLDELHAALERHFIVGIAPGEGVACPSVWLTHRLWRLAIRPGWSGLGADLRWDPEQRWDRARGIASTETRAQRLERHLSSISDWQQFLTRTILRRS